MEHSPQPPPAWPQQKGHAHVPQCLGHIASGAHQERPWPLGNSYWFWVKYVQQHDYSFLDGVFNSVTLRMICVPSPATYRIFEDMRSPLTALEDFTFIYMYGCKRASIYIHRMTLGASYPENYPGALLQCHWTYSEELWKILTSMLRGWTGNWHLMSKQGVLYDNVKGAFWKVLQVSSVFYKNIISHIPLYRWENKGMVNEKKLVRPWEEFQQFWKNYPGYLLHSWRPLSWHSCEKD